MTYAGAAFLVLYLSNRFVAPVSRGAGLALALLPLVFTGKAFLIGGVYGPADLYYANDPWRQTPEARVVGPVRNPILSDVAFANLPWRSAVREAFTNGRIPFWNRFDLAGAPLFPGAGDSFLHPGTWLGIFLPLELSFLFSCTFTIFLALACAFLFFRDHELSPTPALVGAVAWGFSTYVLFWDGFAIGPAVSVFPLILLSLRRLARRPAPASVALAVVALLLGLAGGHPETFFHCLAGGAVYFAWELTRPPRPRIARPAGSALLAGFLALLLGAPILLPLLDALPRTDVYRTRRAASAAGRTHRQSVSAPESARRLLPAILPFSHGMYGRSPVQDWRQDGSGMPVAYSGAVLFPLALLAFRSRRIRRRGRLLFLGFFLAGLGFGASAPVLLDAVSALPGFDVALNWLMVFLAPFGLAGLAAFGAQEIERGAGRAAAMTSAAVLALLVLSFLLSRGVFRERELSESFVRASFAAQLLPLAAFAVAAVALRRSGRVLAAAFVLLLVVERHAEMKDVYPTLPAGSVTPPLPALAALPRGGAPYRVVARDDVLHPNASTLYGLEDVRGYEPVTLAELAETFPLWCRPRHASHQLIEDLTPPFLSLLNARFAVAAPGDPLPEGWLERSRDREMAIFENPRALDRVFVPRRVRFEPDRKSRLAQMARETDFGERAWLSDSDGEAPERGEVPNGRARLSLRSRGPDVLITAAVATPVLLVTSIPAWPGWIAETESGRLQILRVNHAFVGFRLEPGHHEVRLHYRPPTLVPALVACLAGILLIAILGVFAARRRALAP